MMTLPSSLSIALIVIARPSMVPELLRPFTLMLALPAPLSTTSRIIVPPSVVPELSIVPSTCRLASPSPESVTLKFTAPPSTPPLLLIEDTKIEAPPEESLTTVKVTLPPLLLADELSISPTSRLMALIITSPPFWLATTVVIFPEVKSVELTTFKLAEVIFLFVAVTAPVAVILRTPRASVSPR